MYTVTIDATGHNGIKCKETFDTFRNALIYLSEWEHGLTRGVVNYTVKGPRNETIISNL